MVCWPAFKTYRQHKDSIRLRDPAEKWLTFINIRNEIFYKFHNKKRAFLKVNKLGTSKKTNSVVFLGLYLALKEKGNGCLVYR